MSQLNEEEQFKDVDLAGETDEFKEVLEDDDDQFKDVETPRDQKLLKEVTQANEKYKTKDGDAGKTSSPASSETSEEQAGKAEDSTIVPVDKLLEFCQRVMVKAGATPTHAEVLAELLVSADHMGHYSHGLFKLAYYADDISKGIVACDKEPEIIKQGPSTALVNGNNCLGPVVGKMCMDLAIEKAKVSGIGWVTAYRSNHFGIAGWYSMRAMEQELIGMAFTNSNPNSVHPRGKQKLLGTNPISVAAKGDGADTFVLDMATTAVAQGKVAVKQRLGEPVPEGWGVDAAGKSTTDTEEILRQGGLSPLGGREDTGGYKGFGLAMMVEIFCGVLSGSHVGNQVKFWTNADGISEANIGQCFVAIDPQAFAPGFSGRLSELIQQVKGSEPGEGYTQDDLKVAGEPEGCHMEECMMLGGIPYHKTHIDAAHSIAKKYQVDPLVSS